MLRAMLSRPLQPVHGFFRHAGPRKHATPACGPDILGKLLATYLEEAACGVS
jgi:hypothetical protein